MTTNSTETTTPSFEKGSWQENLFKSADLNDKSIKAKKRAGVLLWTGAVEGINQWVPNADTDVSGEGFYNEVLGLLGASRKGDASKIKTVALAVRSNGLDLAAFPNLSKAYAEATRLTKTVAQQHTEDDAIEKAVEAIEAPKSTSSVDGAAALLLSKGVDGAVVAILDALGATNFDAHRAFMRALSSEVADRVQAAKPKPAPKVTTPKTGATKAGPAKAGTKAKPATAKAKPVSASKGDPNKKALPPKATPVTKAKPAQKVAENQSAPVEDAPVEAEVEEQVTEETEIPQVAKPVRRAVPVRRTR